MIYLFCWPGKIRKRASDDRVEVGCTPVMWLTLQIIKVRDRVWKWISKTSSFNIFSVAC